MIKSDDVVVITPNWVGTGGPDVGDVVGPNSLKKIIQIGLIMILYTKLLLLKMAMILGMFGKTKLIKILRILKLMMKEKFIKNELMKLNLNIQMK